MVHLKWKIQGQGMRSGLTVGLFNLSNFVEDMASNIIWGPSQQLIVWGVDRDSGTEWKVTTDKHFVEMVGARL